MRFRLWIFIFLIPVLLPAQETLDPLLQAEKALRSRQDRAAEETWLSVLRQSDDPVDRARATLGLARLRLRQGRLRAAERLLKEMEQVPNADLLSAKRLILTDIALMQDHLQVAEGYLNQLPILSGELDRQRKRLQARLLSRQGEHAQALALLEPEAGQKSDPSLLLERADVLMATDPVAAEVILETLARGTFQDPVTQRALLQLAKQALTGENPEDARLPLERLTSRPGLLEELEAEVYPVYIRLLEQEGKYLEAAAYLKAFAEIVEQPASRIALQALRAQNLIRAGELKLAAQELQQQIALWGDQSETAKVQLYLAREWMNQEDFAAARDAYQAYLSVFSDPQGQLEAETGLAAAQEGLQEYAKAELLYEKVYNASAVDSPLKPLMLVKSADMAYALNNLEPALERYEQFLRDYPDHPQVPQVMIQTADVLAAKKELTRALNLLSRIRLRYPDSDDAEKALMQQAVLLQRSLRPEQALGAYDSYLELYPEGAYVADAITDKGITAYRLGLFDLALRQFKQVSSRFPEHPRVEQAQSLMGWAYYLMGEDEAARRAGREFLEKYPDSVYANEVRFWLAEVAFNRGEYALAAGSFQALTSPGNPQPLRARAHFLAGRALLADKKYEEALKEFEAARVLDGTSVFAADVLFYTGDVLTELGRFDEAILLFDQLIRVHPDSYLVYAARGRMGDCQYTLGEQDDSRYLEALNSYKLVEESPDAGLELRLQAMYKVGRTLNAMGRKEEARRQQEKMIGAYMDHKNKVGSDTATWFLRAVMDVAQSYEQDGESRDAIRIYGKLRDSGLPQAEEAKRRIEDLRDEQKIIIF